MWKHNEPTKQVSVWFPITLMGRMRMVMNERHIARADIIRLAVEHYLDRIDRYDESKGRL